MSKRTLLLIFALFTVAFSLMMIALYQPSKIKVSNKPSSPTSFENLAKATLSFGALKSFSENISSKSAKTVYELPVVIKTNESKITAVQLELAFDPNLLKNVDISLGSFFKNPAIFLNQIDEKTGRISYALGTTNKNDLEKEGIVVELKFELVLPFQKNQINISFLPKTLVTAQDISQSILKNAESLHIVIDKKISTQSGF